MVEASTLADDASAAKNEVLNSASVLASSIVVRALACFAPAGQAKACTKNDAESTGFRNHELTRIRKMVEEHREEFIVAWNEHFRR